MKLTELQLHKVDEALSGLESVLSQIKQKQLRGKNLDAMKTLESAVVKLEVFRITITN